LRSLSIRWISMKLHRVKDRPAQQLDRLREAVVFAAL